MYMITVPDVFSERNVEKWSHSMWSNFFQRMWKSSRFLSPVYNNNNRCLAWHHLKMNSIKYFMKFALKKLLGLINRLGTFRRRRLGAGHFGAAAWALGISAPDIWAPGLSGARIFFLISFFCSYVLSVCSSLRSG